MEKLKAAIAAWFDRVAGKAALRKDRDDWKTTWEVENKMRWKALNRALELESKLQALKLERSRPPEDVVKLLQRAADIIEDAKTKRIRNMRLDGWLREYSAVRANRMREKLAPV